MVSDREADKALLKRKEPKFYGNEEKATKPMIHK